MVETARPPTEAAVVFDGVHVAPLAAARPLLLLVGRHPADNASAADLLEAASAWIDDMDGYFANRGEASPAAASWGLIAHIFAASLIYE